MRIDLGNFGNAQRQVVSADVNRGDVTAMADAKMFGAQAQQRAGQQVAQAWGEVANTATGVGREMEQRNAALAQQKAALQIQRKQIFAQGVIQNAQDQVDAGNLKAADIQNFYNDSMSKFEVEDIDGLHGKGAAQMEKGLQAVDFQMSNDVNHLYRAAHKVETRASVDEMISNTERLTLNGGDLAKGEELYDSDTFRANVREAYGAAAGQKIIEAKAGLYKNHAQNAILNARDSYSGLDDIKKQMGEGGLYYGKLDADTQLQLSGQIESRQSTLEAKAEARAARAEAQQARAFAQQQRQEVNAMNVLNNAQELVNKGNTLSDDYLENLAVQTQGTSQSGKVKELVASMKAQQQIAGLPFPEQQKQIDAINLQLKTQGVTSPEQLKLRDALQQGLDARKAEMKRDPIGATANRTGSEIPALDWSLVGKGGTPEEQRQNNQAFSDTLAQRKSFNDLARQQDPTAPKTLLLPEEREQIAASLKSMNVTQRAHFLAKLQNAGGSMGPQLIKDVGATDLDNAAAYHLNANPHVNTGQLIAQGQELQAEKGSIYKAPEVKHTGVAIEGMYANALPPTVRANLAPTVNAAYLALKAAKGDDPTKWDADLYQSAMRRTVGDVTNYGKGQIVIPFGADAGEIKTKLNSQIDAHPDAENIHGLIDSGEAKLKAVGAHRYMLVQPNGAAWADQSNNPVYLTSN